MKEAKNIIVIGAGFAGMSAATKLASEGANVLVFDKNSMAGGRAQLFKAEGFTFDMGPSWYWMPDVFEDYFNRFGRSVADYYDLVRLDPSYQVVFSETEAVSVPAQMTDFEEFIENLEPGGAEQLRKFLKQAKYKYDVGVGEFVWKPSLSIFEFFDVRLLTKAIQLDLFQSMGKHVRKFFKNPRILQLMEFPILFLGATPGNTPALYSLMNYADIALGTWYPMGGMHNIAAGMKAVAEENGVQFKFNEAVNEILVENGKAVGVRTSSGLYEADVVVAGADYEHVESKLLPQNSRNYGKKYWQDRKMAPSSLLFYLGVNRRVDKLLHHNLFFDEDFDQHAHEIYTEPKWPSKPLFYASAPSKTDSSVAPEGSENVFLLVPIAPDLHDDEATREHYYNIIMNRLEKFCGHGIREHVVFKRSFAVSDFKSEYNSFRGNAYGLANTLLQTAFLKPQLKNKHLDNVYYCGQLSTPGPGVPPSLISGIVVADLVINEQKIEKTVAEVVS
jgi:phytoene desaturase